MIEINLAKFGRRKRYSRAAVIAAAVIAVTGALYFKTAFAPGIYEPPERESSSFAQAPSARKAGKDKRKQWRNPSLRVAGFVSFMDKNFAMLVSGRRALWVEEGDEAFGLKVAKIKEEGIVTRRASGAGGEVFFPFKK